MSNDNNTNNNDNVKVVNVLRPLRLSKISCFIININSNINININTINIEPPKKGMLVAERKRRAAGAGTRCWIAAGHGSLFSHAVMAALKPTTFSVRWGV